jgi:hypothetical protein
MLAGLLVAGLAHRALARRRTAGAPERAVRLARLSIEGFGLLLLGITGALLATGRTVPLRLAFWSLFLLRLSVADLLDPSRLARETGLRESAARDLRTAAGRMPRRRPPPGRRFRSGLTGLAKGALLVLWVALPLLAALAPGEVAAGTWPRWALWLRLYPPAALLLTSGLLAIAGLRSMTSEPWDAARSLLAGLATGLYVVAIYAEPSFGAYRHSLAGLYLAETLAAFLLGTVSRGR